MKSAEIYLPALLFALFCATARSEEEEAVIEIEIVDEAIDVLIEAKAEQPIRRDDSTTAKAIEPGAKAGPIERLRRAADVAQARMLQAKLTDLAKRDPLPLIRALQSEYGGLPVQRVEALVKELGSESWRERENATRRLIGMGPAVSPMLVPHAAHRDLEVRVRARHILESIKNKLRYRVAKTRREVLVKALARCGDPRAVPILCRALGDATGDVARHASYALIQQGAGNAGADLIATLGSSDPNARWRSAEVIGKLRIAVAFEALAGALEDLSVEVRYNAAWALGRIGNLGALPALLPMLDDPDATVREFAAEALSMLTKRRVRDIRDRRKRADYIKVLRAALKVPEPIPKAASAPSSQ